MRIQDSPQRPEPSIPVDVINVDMAVEWTRTAMNTAGHAVALAVLELPLHEARVQLDPIPQRFRVPTWLTPESQRFAIGAWRVLGRAEVAPRGGDVELDPADTDKWLVMNMAGRAAEARWRVEIEHVRFAWYARRLVDRSPHVQGTRDEVRQLLASPDTTLTAKTARARTLALVDEHWAAMNRVAAALSATAHLTGHQVRNLL